MEKSATSAEASQIEMDVAAKTDFDGPASEVQTEPALKKNFNTFSMLGLAVTMMASWEATCGVLIIGLVSGGPVSLVYGYILAFFGALATCLSLSEMAAMCPTSGGQYHWVTVLGPPSSKRFLSWIAGWLTVLAWQAVAASLAILCGTFIQALVMLNHPSYVAERWHSTLMYWAIVLLGVFLTTVWARFLPMFEKLVLVIHVTLFGIMMIVLGVMAPKSSPDFVYQTFINLTGWKSDGIAWCLGLLSAAYCFIGYDGASHLSEELPNAAHLLPRIMVASIVINGVMGFAFITMLLFCLDSIIDAISTSTGYPVLYIFIRATGSVGGATAMMASIYILMPFASMSLLASTSRTTWAFARDGGLPFSPFFAKISPRFNVPVNATILSGAVLVILGCINIGSTTAFNAIISLAVSGLNLSYLFPIVLIIVARCRGQKLPYGPFRLGKSGLAINIFAAIYTTFICVISLFPSQQPVTTLNMNYASVVLSVVLILAVLWWFVDGRKNYVGPLIVIEGVPSLMNRVTT